MQIHEAYIHIELCGERHSENADTRINLRLALCELFELGVWREIEFEQALLLLLLGDGLEQLVVPERA